MIFQTDGDVAIQMPVDSSPEPPAIPLRHELVSTAVSFLSNPQVVNNSVAQKKAFLLRKGLTSDEVEHAIEWASKGMGAYRPPQDPKVPDPFAVGMYRPVPYPTPVYQPPGLWFATQSLAPAVALVAGMAYGLYLFYKNYIEPRLFSRKKHPLVLIMEGINKLSETVDKMNDGLVTIELNIRKQIEKEMAAHSRPTPTEVAAINEIKREIQSIKTLLLNRKNFPEAPIPSHQVSIPEWQKSDDAKDRQ